MLKESQLPKTHIKSSSQVKLKYSTPSNFYVTKLMNQNTIKNKSLLHESIPNLKNSIQNLFSSDEKKEKIFQFLIKKNRDRSANRSKENNLKTASSIYNEDYSIEPNNNNDLAKSCLDIRSVKNYHCHSNSLMNSRYSGSAKYNQDEYPMNKNNINKNICFEYNNQNNVHQNKNRVYANLIVGNSNSKFRNRNKGNNGNNEYEHISIYNTYNNTFNNYKMQKNKNKGNRNNNRINNHQTYQPTTYRRTVNISEKKPSDNNPINDYMRNTHLSNNNNRNNSNHTNIIVNSDTENNIKDNNIKIYYLKKAKNEKTKQPKDDSFNQKKNPLSSNISFTNNNKKMIYYIHKNVKYKKMEQKKSVTVTGELNSGTKNDKIIDNNNNKVYEKRKNYYDLYGTKDIRVNTIDNKRKNPILMKNCEKDTDNDSLQLTGIKVNIDKSLQKDFYNSPLSSSKFNKYFKNNNYYNNRTANNFYTNNKKIYEKRDLNQRSSLPKSITTQFDNEDNNAKKILNTESCVNIKNNNKFVFNNEDEILEFIKRKYNKRNVNEILISGNRNKDSDINELKTDKQKTELMTTEEGNRIKLKNEELSTEIKELKYKNQQYEIALNDIKNKFDNLTKEIHTIKENK